jgi:hypothetical protein
VFNQTENFRGCILIELIIKAYTEYFLKIFFIFFKQRFFKNFIKLGSNSIIFNKYTLLRSSFVNKSSREQVEKRLYKKKVNLVFSEFDFKFFYSNLNSLNFRGISLRLSKHYFSYKPHFKNHVVFLTKIYSKPFSSCLFFWIWVQMSLKQHCFFFIYSIDILEENIHKVLPIIGIGIKNEIRFASKHLSTKFLKVKSFRKNRFTKFLKKRAPKFFRKKMFRPYRKKRFGSYRKKKRRFAKYFYKKNYTYAQLLKIKSLKIKKEKIKALKIKPFRKKVFRSFSKNLFRSYRKKINSFPENISIKSSNKRHFLKKIKRFRKKRSRNTSFKVFYQRPLFSFKSTPLFLKKSLVLFSYSYCFNNTLKFDSFKELLFRNIFSIKEKIFLLKKKHLLSSILRYRKRFEWSSLKNSGDSPKVCYSGGLFIINPFDKYNIYFKLILGLKIGPVSHFLFVDKKFSFIKEQKIQFMNSLSLIKKTGLKNFVDFLSTKSIVFFCSNFFKVNGLLNLYNKTKNLKNKNSINPLLRLITRKNRHKKRHLFKKVFLNRQIVFFNRIRIFEKKPAFLELLEYAYQAKFYWSNRGKKRFKKKLKWFFNNRWGTHWPKRRRNPFYFKCRPKHPWKISDRNFKITYQRKIKKKSYKKLFKNTVKNPKLKKNTFIKYNYSKKKARLKKGRHLLNVYPFKP